MIALFILRNENGLQMLHLILQNSILFRVEPFRQFDIYSNIRTILTRQIGKVYLHLICNFSNFQCLENDHCLRKGPLCCE